MELHVLASGSFANGYLLHNGEDALIVECGVHLLDVKKALNFNIAPIVGCLVSHSHNDHSKYMSEYLGAAIPVLASHKTFETKGVKSHYAKIVEPGKGYIIGEYRVMPFELSHDAPCLGFLVDHPDMGRLAFITDTYYCEHAFIGVNHWLIEANYADDILYENITTRAVNFNTKKRLMFSHMEIETTKEILMANDCSKTNSIVLIHLSNANSSSHRFKSEIESLLGIPTYIAEKGLTIDLNRL